MKKKALIIDDDKKLQELLKEYLEEDEFNVILMYDGLDWQKTVDNESPDIIILDIMLPGCSGLNVMKEIKKKYHMPIILLTAKGEDTDRIVGLELGADDYLPKPASAEEITQSIKSLL